MALKRQHNLPHSSLYRILIVSIAAALAPLLLAGCSLSAQLGRAPSPTLVPTLSIIIPPTLTPQPMPTLAPDTATPSPTETRKPSSTPTVTPFPTSTATPTFGPSPTTTRTATATRIPTRTRTITPTPTITFTPTPPAPVINLVRPGLMSKVVSPVQMEVYGVTGGDTRLTFELVGEDGRVISRQVQNYGDARQRVWISPDLPFEINAAAETARLQALIFDEFGRPEALASVDLILLQVGRNDINPPAVTQELFLVRQPEPDALVSGGMLTIEGLARPLNDSPLLIELMDENGVTLTTKQVQVAAPSGALSHTPFTVQIAYKVSGPTPVRMIMRQEGSRIPGTVALASQLMVLLP